MSRDVVPFRQNLIIEKEYQSNYWFDFADALQWLKSNWQRLNKSEKKRNLLEPFNLTTVIFGHVISFLCIIYLAFPRKASCRLMISSMNKSDKIKEFHLTATNNMTSSFWWTSFCFLTKQANERASKLITSSSYSSSSIHPIHHEFQFKAINFSIWTLAFTSDDQTKVKLMALEIFLYPPTNDDLHKKNFFSNTWIEKSTNFDYRYAGSCL